MSEQPGDQLALGDPDVPVIHGQAALGHPFRVGAPLRFQCHGIAFVEFVVHLVGAAVLRGLLDQQGYAFHSPNRRRQV